jgi:hypothetical protein
MYLTGLAQDVLEHGECDGCKINAANGLDKLGLLQEVLAATGQPDPRPSSGPFAPDHAAAPLPTPRDDAETFQVSVVFSLPYEATREAAKRKLHDVMESVKAAVVAENGVVQGLEQSMLRDYRPAFWVDDTPPAEG